MKLLAGVWAFVKRLPLAHYLKPLWKGVLKAAVPPIIDGLGDRLIEEVQKDLVGSRAKINQLIDEAQDKIKDLIEDSWLPDSAESKLIRFIGPKVDEFQKNINDALDTGSSGAVSAQIKSLCALLAAQLIAKIDAL